MNAYWLGVFNRLKYGVLFTVLIFLFLLIVLWHRVVHIVPAGHGAVIWHTLRHQLMPGYEANLVGEGLALVWPWDRFYEYDLRLKTHTETYPVVSEEGLHFEVDMTFRWRVVGENLVELNKEIGPDYLSSMLVPEIGSVLRYIVATYPAEALYTVERNNVQNMIYEQVTSSSLTNHIGPRIADDPLDTILLQDTLMTSIRLPQTIQDAIERKLTEAEMVEEYQFRVERERLESERKQVEAEGIRNFQQTVAPAITESYLQWRGIEATIELATSENSKVVVIGNSKNGLPLILDVKDGIAAGSTDAPAQSSAPEEGGTDSPAN